MISPLKAITAGVFIFAIGGAVLLAEPFDQQGSVPGAPSEDAHVEFVTEESVEELSAYEYDASGNEIIRMAVEASDPRLSGAWTEVWGCRGAPVEVCVASVRVENEGGTWLGTHEGYRREGIDNLAPTILEGQDGYAGLTAVLDYAQHHGASVGKGIAGDGYIVDFEMPDPPEPFAE